MRSLNMYTVDHIRALGFACALAFVSSCASAGLPARAPAQTEAAIESARAGGAETLAPEAFATALEKSAAASEAARKGKLDKARLLSDEAAADAELAQAQALTIKTRMQIEQVRASTDSLRESIRRTE